jgi:branched-chain amino acid transport system permease protein
MLRPHAVVPAILVLSLAGCATLIDTDQARICRTVIPALNPAGTVLALGRQTPAEDRRGLRIVYRAEPPGEPARTRFVACRFADAGGRPELAGVATERGPLGDASFLYLRRFYLGVPDALLEDPGAPEAADVPSVPHAVAYGLQQVVGGLPQAAVYGLLAAAYSLIYGLVGRIVFGFGEIASLGGYGALLGVTLAVQLGARDPMAGLAVAAALSIYAACLYGMVSGRLVVAPLVSGPGLPILIATTGLMMALSEFQRLTQGDDLRWAPPVMNAPVPLVRSGDFVTTVTPIAVLVTCVAFAAGAALLVIMRRTRFGRAWRAYSDDPGAAALFGVDSRRIFLATFALSSALAGLAGFVITAYWGGVGFGYGLTLGLKALVAAIIGGIGSVGGGLAGGVVIGLAEALWSATMPLESRDIAIYALLSITLGLRPGGLFGWRDLLPRRV